MFTFLRLLENSNESEEIKNLIIKVICLITLLGMAIGFSFMPYFIISCRKSNKFLRLSNSFSAGIFLSMGLIHILPECAEMLKQFSDLPLAYIFCFLSYSFILFIEKIVFNSHSLLHNDNHENNGNNSLYEDNCIKQEEGEEYIETNESKEESPKSSQRLEIKINQNKEVSSLKNLGDSIELNVIENKIKKNDSQNENGLTSYILLIALGFHGLFEGITLGIQSTIRKTLFLFLAILLHKWAASLSLGISFVKSGINKKQFIIMIIIFSSITPIGISFGMILTSLSNDILAGIFLSISVGTFIYIACSEIVIDEFSNHEYKYIKFIFFLFGAGVENGLSIIETYSEIGHEHNHVN